MVATGSVPEATAKRAARITVFVSQQLTLGLTNLRSRSQGSSLCSAIKTMLCHQSDTTGRSPRRPSAPSFFRPTRPGYTPILRPNEIWIRGDISELELIIVVAHELRHLYQRTLDRASFDGVEFLAEFDAYTFSTVAAEEFLLCSQGTDADLRTVRRFSERAIRDLAIDAVRAGLSPEMFCRR
jgi:hypothetical protein